MARILKFDTDERQRQHFATMFVVFASSGALPQSMDDLLTASAIKRKCGVRLQVSLNLWEIRTQFSLTQSKKNFLKRR